MHSLALSSFPFALTTTPASTGSSSHQGQQPTTAPAPPRLILTTKGINTPELKATFTEMIQEATPAGAEQPTIAVVITAMLAPGQKPKNEQQAMAAKAASEALAAEAAAAAADGAEGDVGSAENSSTASESAAAAAASKTATERAALAAAATVAAEEVVAEAGLPARVRVLDVSRDSREHMEATLAEAACTFVLGGNTFYLMHWMRVSGFDALVRRRVSEGMLYVGASAGSIVAGQSISTAYWKGWDDPKAATDLGADFQDPRALALVPDHSFFPHHLPEWEETVQRKKPDLGHSLITLREDCGCGCYVSGRGRGRGSGFSASASIPPPLPPPPVVSSPPLDPSPPLQQPHERHGQPHEAPPEVAQSTMSEATAAANAANAATAATAAAAAAAAAATSAQTSSSAVGA